jgi:hypothetical protein
MGFSTMPADTAPDVKRGTNAMPSRASMNASTMRMSLKRWLTCTRLPPSCSMACRMRSNGKPGGTPSQVSSTRSAGVTCARLASR